LSSDPPPGHDAFDQPLSIAFGETPRLLHKLSITMQVCELKASDKTDP
jgi:hypothetical protein